MFPYHLKLHQAGIWFELKRRDLIEGRGPWTGAGRIGATRRESLWKLHSYSQVASLHAQQAKTPSHAHTLQLYPPLHDRCLICVRACERSQGCKGQQATVPEGGQVPPQRGQGHQRLPRGGVAWAEPKRCRWWEKSVCLPLMSPVSLCFLPLCAPATSSFSFFQPTAPAILAPPPVLGLQVNFRSSPSEPQSLPQRSIPDFPDEDPVSYKGRSTTSFTSASPIRVVI